MIFDIFVVDLILKRVSSPFCRKREHINASFGGHQLFVKRSIYYLDDITFLVNKILTWSLTVMVIGSPPSGTPSLASSAMAAFCPNGLYGGGIDCDVCGLLFGVDVFVFFASSRV